MNRLGSGAVDAGDVMHDQALSAQKARSSRCPKVARRCFYSVERWRTSGKARGHVSIDVVGVRIVAAGFTVDALAQVLAGLEVRHVLAGQRDGLAGLGIAALARRAEMQAEAAEAADLDALPWASASLMISRICLTASSTSFAGRCPCFAAMSSMSSDFVMLRSPSTPTVPFDCSSGQSARDSPAARIVQSAWPSQGRSARPDPRSAPSAGRRGSCPSTESER